MASVDNHLIHLISRPERLALLGLCDKVPLVLSQVLWKPDKPTEHVYFPVEGFISLMAMVKGHPGVEVGMMGREGMLGVQSQLAISPSTKRILDRYVSLLMSQFITSSTCFHYHAIGPRLARWLLMSQDRAGSDRFSMTHEFIACMLGTRRVSVTLAAGLLQQEGLIEYSRGKLRVLDRARLEATACDCYDIDRRSYVDLLG